MRPKSAQGFIPIVFFGGWLFLAAPLSSVAEVQQPHLKKDSPQPWEAFGIIRLSPLALIYSPLRLKTVEFGRTGSDEEKTLVEPGSPFTSIALKVISRSRMDGSFQLQFAPGISYNRWDRDALELEVFNFLYSGKILWHSPVGVFFAKLGLGPSYFRSEIIEGSERSKLRLAPRYGMTWMAFPWKRVFFALGFRRQVVPTNTFVADGFTLKSFTTYSLGVGVAFGPFN